MQKLPETLVYPVHFFFYFLIQYLHTTYKSEVTANRQNIKLRNKVKLKGTLNGLYFTPVRRIYRTTQQRRHGNPEILAPETYCLWTDIWWSVNKAFQSIWKHGACSIKPQHRRTNVCCRVTISSADYTRCVRQGTRDGNITDASARTCCEHTIRNILIIVQRDETQSSL